MVQMRDRQAQAERLGDLAKDSQETHAVATSGNGNDPDATHASVEPALDSSPDVFSPVAGHGRVDRVALKRRMAAFRRFAPVSKGAGGRSGI